MEWVEMRGCGMRRKGGKRLENVEKDWKRKYIKFRNGCI